MKQISLLLILLNFLVFFSACEKEENTNLNGMAQFSFALNELNNRTTSNADPSAIWVTVLDRDNQPLLEDEKIDLIFFNDEFITEPISLVPGDYSITKFMVLDENNNVIYATPVEGSDLSHLVTMPLPVDFVITEDATSKLELEVVSTEAGSGADFGYSTFTFGVVDYVQFLVAPFAYDFTSANFELTNATYELFSGTELIVSGNLYDSTNVIISRIYDSYTLVVNKPSYEEFTIDLTYEEIQKYTIDPLEIILLGNGYAGIVIQPDSSNGKDASVWTEEPDSNYGETTGLHALAWTWTADGYNDGIWLSFIEFDISSIPLNGHILKATLTLSFDDDSYFSNLYSLHKPNEAKLQRVIEAWDEDLITWNNQPSASLDGEILIPSTIDSPGVDYKIDVTGLVRDQKELGNFGFKLSLQNEDYYRGVVLASSDDSNPTNHPKLEIIYTE